MISLAVLDRYARSLADVAFETGEVDAVARDMETYSEIFSAVPDLLIALDSPAVQRDAKEKVRAELLSRYPVRPLSANFLRVLLQHNRIRYFHEIYRSFFKIIDARRGIVTAKVTSSSPLSDAELARLREELSRVTGKTVNLDVQTDPELLGGVVVQVESTLYDGSIRRQLEEMKRQLSGA